MQNSAEYVLEKYVEGKDQNKPGIFEKIYLPDAKVLFAIDSDTISFPSEISGSKDIARVLSMEFNQKYDHVKTYYLSRDFPKIEDLKIIQQPWLVIMREKENHQIRVGAGYYDWIFEKRTPEKLIIKMHRITIGVMLSLSGLALSFLEKLQANLSCPWTDKNTALTVMGEAQELKAVHDYIIKSSCKIDA